MAFTLFKDLIYRDTDLSNANDSDDPEKFAIDGVICDPGDATLVTSKLRNDPGHAVILDIDCPNAAIPSATSGHIHIYLQPPEPVTMKDLMEFLRAGAKIRVFQKGWVEASEKRGYTALRVP